MIKKREPKVPCKDVERRLASEREGEEERCNLELISQPCPIHGSTSTSTYGRMRGLRRMRVTKEEIASHISDSMKLTGRRIRIDSSLHKPKPSRSHSADLPSLYVF